MRVWIVAIAAGVSICCSSLATAGIILETAPMGETVDDPQNGFFVDYQMLAARFSLSEAHTVTAIGGHLASAGTLWGAIVEIQGADGLPSFAASDIEANAVAHATFTPGTPSSDFRAPLNVSLEAGDYALVFGGAFAFGANDGYGAMPTVDPNPYPATYFHGNLAGPLWWDGGLWGARFVVEGEPAAKAVPEPSSMALLGMGACLTGACAIRRRFAQLLGACS